MTSTRSKTEEIAHWRNRLQLTLEDFEHQKNFFESEAAENKTTEEIDFRLLLFTPLQIKLEEAVERLTLLLNNEDDSTELREKKFSFNDDFCRVAAKVKQIIKKSEKNAVQQAMQEPFSQKTSLKTPKIELPEFNGAIEQWTHFRDMFIALVHDNHTLDDIQKFHFLRTSLKLPTGMSNIVDNYPFTAENYKPAWDAVQERYNDKRKIVKHHLKKLFSVKKMSQSTSVELRKLLDAVTSNLSALSQQGFSLNDSDNLSNLLIVHIVTESLDDETIKQWRLDCKEDFVSWTEIHDFLKTLQRSLDEQQFNSMPMPKQEAKTSRAKSLVSNVSKDTANKCPLCSALHRLIQCEQFRNKNVTERHTIVKDKQLCHNCLSAGHRSKDCPSKYRCRNCEQPHHTMIHFDRVQQSNQSLPNQQGSSNAPLSPSVAPFVPVSLNRQQPTLAHSTVSSLTSSLHTVNKQTMLSTVLVKIFDKDGNSHLGRALLDSGSDSCFMTSSFANQLGLRTVKAMISITGINEKTVLLKQRTNATVQSRFNDFSKTCQFYVMPSITGKLPTQSIPLKEFNIPDDLYEQLADPDFHQSGQIDLLLDNSVFWECLMAQIYQVPNGPTLRCTHFGWLIGGEVTTSARKSSSFLSCFTKNEPSGDCNLDNKLDQFFSTEEIDSTKPVLSAEETYCEDLYAKTTTKVDGKYMVRMPFKQGANDLGRNLKAAMHASYRLDSKRKQDANYNQLYTDYMSELIQCGYMSAVEPPKDQPVHYLPHHGVIKMSSTSTKLRPVFNASSQSETGISLNDTLCVGPKTQPELVEILLRARERQYIVMGDITKMFLQIWIAPEQRDYLRILWRPHLDEPLQHFRMNTVTFGTACAPYLATRTICQLANDNEMNFPEASRVMKESFYVDDLCFSSDSIDHASQTLVHIRYILQNAGMTLCKIVSNNEEILQQVPVSSQHVAHETNETLKALGISFNAKTDYFSFDLKPMATCSSTKANVLSNIASIFDPMGWLGPVVLTAKLIMKSLWMTPMKWTDNISPAQQIEWDEFREQFPALNEIKIKRHCIIINPIVIDIHGFCDASIVGYGAVVYARSIDGDGRIQVSILCAKSRVAPKMQKTLARLELCSAVLLTKLMSKVVSNLTVNIDSVNLWSDSTIVLHWLTIEPARLQTFVGNRVAAIQELTRKNFVWRHIRGEDNPADVISRGLQPSELQDCHIWWHGPTFFQKQSSEWPDTILTVSTDDPEIKAEMKRTLTTTKPNDLFQITLHLPRSFVGFIKHRTLCNVLAFVNRFIHNLRKRKPISGKVLLDVSKVHSPTLEEFEKAKLTAIKLVQQEMFHAEYKELKRTGEDQNVQKSSPIRSLLPFIDSEGIMRVGGRLAACQELTFDQKHPIILPQCPFTYMIVRELHQIFLHPGPSALMSFVKQQYWPVRAKSIIRKITHDCIRCFRAKPRDTNQRMSDLPEARVTLTRPFQNTALDYAGPYVIRSGTTRNAPHTKCYIAMFKCMCTGAIHLELVSDLTTPTFLAALDRFVSRRGKPSKIFSDNGTNFHGADNELKTIVSAATPAAQDFFKQQSIQWQFTTPLAPHAGGIYESGIKSMKHHLKRLLNTVYTFEQLLTIICKVEAVLNSRPLTPLSDDPKDLQVLTPGHFLIGAPLISVPQRDNSEISTNRLKTWAGLQQIQQKFWQSWYHDYLHNLQRRPAKFQDVSSIKIGDMVLVKDANLPPLKWLMARVIKLYPSPRDKIVRNVKVLTQLGEKDRHVKYLCLLPLEVNTDLTSEESASPGQCVPDGI